MTTLISALPICSTQNAGIALMRTYVPGVMDDKDTYNSLSFINGVIETAVDLFINPFAGSKPGQSLEDAVNHLVYSGASEETARNIVVSIENMISLAVYYYAPYFFSEPFTNGINVIHNIKVSSNVLLIEYTSRSHLLTDTGLCASI